jgi:urease accessory protein
MRSGPIHVLVAILLLVPTSAFAHFGADHTHSFGEGFAHPLGGLDHILAMVTVGLLAWQLGGRAIWLVPAAFVSFMALGGALGIAGQPLSVVECGIAASVIVLGAMVAFGIKPPVAGAAAIVGLFAIFHGYAHGAGMPADASAGAFAVGFILATVLLHACGMGTGLLVGRFSDRYGTLAYRAAGTFVAVAGVAILTQTIRL